MSFDRWVLHKPLPASMMTDRQPMIIGHRGACGLAPENTLSAFQAAAELGADGVEFDVQGSKDGHLVIIHDETTKRTTQTNVKVVHQMLAELKELDAGSWFAEKYYGERIPTLQELFDYMGGNDLLMFIEIKYPDYTPDIEQKIADLVREYDYVERVQVSSFHFEYLERLYEYAPEISIAELWLDRVPEVAETASPTVHGFYELYNQEVVQTLHERGQKTVAWTVNDLQVAQDLQAWGVDGIMTDFPNKLLKGLF